MELLAPAGNPKALKAAIYSKADAVYLGLDNFNARINAENFTKENIRDYVKLCHLHDVKVYVTFNTIVKDDEFPEFEEAVQACVNAKVDAFIVTDLGTLSVFSKYGVPLHASTQLGVHNLEGAKYVESLGFKRVILSRETLLEDIKNIKENTSLEIEYFVHGALCVSFSGGCLLSYYMTGTSGNRGLCKQPCRLLYKSSLNEQEKYYLSPADQCLVENIEDLKKIGVDSIKIEGRLKSPYYVGAVVNVYKKALEGTYSREYMHNLYRAYNRGHFTKGYNYDSTKDIMSIDIQNNIGDEVGKIIDHHGSTLVIESNYDFKIGDGVKITKGGKEIGGFAIDNVTKSPDGIYFINTVRSYSAGSIVHLTQEKSMVEEYDNVDLALPLSIKIDISSKGAYFLLESKGKTIDKTFDIVSKAQSRDTTKADIQEKAEKVGDSSFYINNIEVSVKKGLFVPMSMFNRARREIMEALENKIIMAYEIKMPTYKLKQNIVPIDFSLDKYLLEVSSLDNIDKYKDVVLSVKNYNDKKLIDAINGLDVKFYLRLPKICRGQDMQVLKEFIDSIKSKLKGFLVENIYGISVAREYNFNYILGSGMNIMNKFASYYLGSNEYISSREKDNISSNEHILVSDKILVMTLTHCPIQINTGCSCASCKYQGEFIYSNNSLDLILEREKLNHCYFNVFIKS